MNIKRYFILPYSIIFCQDAYTLEGKILQAISDLRALLANSVITEQRSFIKSFVEKIEVDDEKAKMYYTIPVPSDSISQETTGVLPSVHHG